MPGVSCVAGDGRQRCRRPSGSYRSKGGSGWNGSLIERGLFANRPPPSRTKALAESGAAGPTGNSYGDAAGHCCFAVSGPAERCLTIETADADREANMWAFAKAALDLLEETLHGHG